MRILGLDWGTVRIGVAVSDPLGISALPIDNIANDKNTLKNINLLIERYEISEIVLGLPKKMNGELGAAAENVMRFCDLLKTELSLNIVLWDERMTTKIADKAYAEAGISSKNRRSIIDSSAASIMLESYMDHKKNEKKPT
jgi:putative holliday junction resolvase